MRTVVVGLVCILCTATISLQQFSMPVFSQSPAVASSRPLKQSPMVTGNGLGFAVLSPAGQITKFYAHPYRFEHPNPDESKDGSETTNFLKGLSWTGGPQSGNSADVDYLNESQILSVKTSGGEQQYFMPFGLKRNTLIALWRPAANKESFTPNLALRPDWLHQPLKDELKEVEGRKVRLLQFKDVKELLALVPLTKDPPVTSPEVPALRTPEDTTVNPLGAPAARRLLRSAEPFLGTEWVLISLEKPEQLDGAIKDLNVWQGKLNSAELIQREIEQLDSWRVKPKVTFKSDKEKHLWRQNETFLRMSQIQESNNHLRHNHGLILASLPDGMWFMAWVRDMAYAVVSLIRMGHAEEAKVALLSFFNARPVGKWKHETRNHDYQISVTRYFGDGTEEADYSGLQTPNVELDDWGLALWAVSEYFEKTHDMSFLSTPTYRGTVYESLKHFVVAPLLGNLDPAGDGLIVAADSSLWEEHQQNKKHYAFSTFSCIAGLRGFLKIAEAMKDEKEVKLVSEKLDLLEKGFKSAFIRDGVVWGSVEPSFKNEIDGSLIEAFNFGVVTDPAVRDKTLAKVELLKTASGGYKRVRGPSNYEKQEFLFVNFSLVRVLQREGKSAKAQKMIDRMVEKSCQDHGLIAECYVSEKNDEFTGEIGDPTGSIPMVGYGAGAYIITLLEREKD